MPERFVKANGIEIWTEDFGNASDPAVLLVMGASAQGIFWPDEFCGLLVDAGRYVIRFDNRDVGQSRCFDFSADPYTISDMARDAVGVLDAYGIARAHVVGASMGGMICQTLAIEHAERVITFTAIMSSPGGEAVAQVMQGGDAEDALPPPTQAVIEAAMANMMNPPTTREECIDQRVKLFGILSGSLAEFDEVQSRELFGREYDRARSWTAQNNHGLAVAASSDRRAALAGVSTPALVIHGTEDPILPYAHGLAIKNAVPGAKLVTIEKMGHDMPEVAWPTIIGSIVEHTAG
jgi:pimeloyl-ACP methyl ester carboxylesterase